MTLSLSSLHNVNACCSYRLGAVSDITCLCSRCVVTNGTCTSSGQCVSYSSRASKDGNWISSSGCLQSTDDTSQCNLPSTPTWHIFCCKEDRCNLHLKLSEPTTAGETLRKRRPDASAVHVPESASFPLGFRLLCSWGVVADLLQWLTDDLQQLLQRVEPALSVGN